MIIKTNGSQKESQVIEPEHRIGATLRYEFEYDTKHPEDKVRSFVMDVKGMIAKFNANIEQIKDLENQLSDLEHYMEVTNYKCVPEGYKLYRKLASIRRERRALKSENDILRPVVEYFRSNTVLDKLGNVQGDTAKVKSLVDARVYTVRTDVLDEFMEDKKKKKDIQEEEPVAIADDTDEEVILPDLPEILQLPSIEQAYAK